MKRLSEIIGLFKPYKVAVTGHVVFSLLEAIFSVFTFASTVPLLQILFGTTPPVDQIQEVDWSFSNAMDWVQYKLSLLIATTDSAQVLLYFCVFLITTSLFKNLFTYFSMHQMAIVRNGVVRDLREMLYMKILRLPLSWFGEEHKGDVLSRATNDVVEVEWGIIGSIKLMFKSPITLIVYLATLVIMSWKLTIFGFVVLPISGLLIARVAKGLKGAAKRGQKQLGKVISRLEETLGGMRIIKAFGAEDQLAKQFKEENDNFYSKMVSLFRRQQLASPISEFLGTAAVTLLLFYGGQLVLSPEASLSGEFFIYYLVMFSQLIPPAKQLSDATFRIQKASASLDRINQVLNADEVIFEKENAMAITSFERELNFENVSFSYQPETPVLKNISFKIEQGQTVALVGHSGGGKSTIADLVPRFFDVTKGRITVDGNDLRDLRIADWRSLLGVVSQHSVLFNDSVANNITLGDENPDRERMVMAARIANALDFIEELEDGFDTSVGDGGFRLSGGQRQRLSIARAIYKNPPLLILDEATSALDTQSELKVQQAIESLMKGRTTLVIAHRLSTIRHADKILVIDQGEIAEVGTHDELLIQEGVYSRLVAMQNFD